MSVMSDGHPDNRVDESPSEHTARDLSRIARGLFPEVASPAIAGMFGAGEIGPVGDRSYLHGHSACVAILRPGREAFDAG